MLGFALFPFPSWTPLRCPALRAVQTVTFPLLTGAADSCLVPRELRIKSAGRYFFHPLDQWYLEPCSIWEAWSGQAVCLRPSLCFVDLLPLAPEPLADGEGWLGWGCCTRPCLVHKVAANKWVCPDKLDLAWCHPKLSQHTGLPATGGFLARDGVCFPPLGCNKVSRALPQVSDCLWR